MRAMLVIVFTLAACDDVDDGGDACSNPAEVTGEILSAPTKLPVAGDLVVRGTIDAPINATVYAVLVNGIAAANDHSNFRGWSATVPIAVLVGEAKADKARLSVMVHSNCGPPQEVASAVIDVDTEPGVVVERIELSKTLPNGQSYLPSSKPVSAVLTIVANPSAAGARVALS